MTPLTDVELNELRVQIAMGTWINHKLVLQALDELEALRKERLF